MAWSLYKCDEFLKPIVFSNGKSQEDVVDEVLSSIKKGKKIIFIHGICGTGKSAIALNIARKLGKTSIVVPIKNLQEQYKKDYGGNGEGKYVLKGNRKLDISVITGRKNHKCKFLEKNKEAIPKKEIDSNLHDIFEGVKEKFRDIMGKDISANNSNLPCKIEIKKKNIKRLKEYIKQNKDVKINDFSDIKDVKRISVAGACPFWSPVIPEKYELGGKSFVNAIQKRYKGIKGKDFIFYHRKPGCSFYEQFNSYVNSDLIVFNSLKYKLESYLGRKPLTEVEVIDECDEFLDSFSNQRKINLERLTNALIYVFGDEEAERILSELRNILQQIRNNQRIKIASETKEIIPLKETGVYDLIKIFLKNPEIFDEADEESYVFEVEETAKMFEEFLEETYVTVDKKEENLIINLVTTNLAKRFKELVDKNKVIVLMSGTLHSKEVLKHIFGLEDFEIIEAETEQQGRIESKRIGVEEDCKYSNFSCGRLNRKGYLKSLDKCVEISKKPTLVHVNAFLDLPNEIEKKELKLKNLISREKLKEIQDEDKKGKLVEEFKSGKKDILFSTRSGRGIDFPGEMCNSIVFTKYPNPNVKDAFWKILQRTNPQHYWSFYRDKAKRELWQKIYRGVRFKEDHVYVLSPDSRVLDVFENI